MNFFSEFPSIDSINKDNCLHFKFKMCETIIGCDNELIDKDSSLLDDYNKHIASHQEEEKCTSSTFSNK